MASFLDRKKPLPPAFERLEGRCVLSQFGPTAGRDGSPPAMEDPARMTPVAETSAPPSQDRTGFGRTPAGAPGAPGAPAEWRSREAGDSQPWSPAGGQATPLASFSAREARDSWPGGMGWSQAQDEGSAPSFVPPATPRPSTDWSGDPAGSSAMGRSPSVEAESAPSPSTGGGASLPSSTPAETSAGRPAASPDDLTASPARPDPHAVSPAAVATGAASPAGLSTRSPAPAPIVRSADTVTTARAEGSPGAETAPASPAESPATVLGPIPSVGGSELSARGSTPVPVVIGLDSPEASTRPALDVESRGGAGTPTAAGSRTPPGWRAGGADESGVAQLAGAIPAEGPAAVDPQLAGVITSVLPFGRATIEEAIDQFLEPFDGFAPSLLGMGGPLGLVTASLTVASTVLAAEVAIRLRRSRDEGEGEGESGPARFPGLPGFRRWSRP